MRKMAYLVAPALLGFALSSMNALPMPPSNQPQAVLADTLPAQTVRYTPNFDHVRSLIFYGINHLRQENGLAPVQYNQTITDAWAQKITNQNAVSSNLAHNMTSERQAMHSIGYYFFGENIAMTPINVSIRSGANILTPITSDEQLAIGLITQYYDDVGVTDFGHRKNLLNPWYTQVGIAFAQRTDTDGVTRVYNSLDFAGTSTIQTNNMINSYVAYTSAIGVNDAQWPSHYTPLNDTNIDAQSGMYGVVHYNNGDAITLWDGYTDQKIPSGRYLANGTAWKINSAETDDHGHLWYEVGPNQWIDSTYVNTYSW
ncbi:CAP domain-containing protein [Lactobacillus sp. CC-MHH1034]|uniref:CAP domain-containing protein n=1 Tax=Agrilactobacillus fermenti TaxID=2586909 RepID=UPI001E2D3C29|nr:CAP domain-containing protein [Agrilactobacillus fermenti]MCD2256511.1 CAP domain-containing protein [Agrilactobacillus fermenti]